MKNVLPGAALVALSSIALSTVAIAASAPQPRPGVPGVQTKVEDLKAAHTFELGGFPDWMVLIDGSVWVSNSPQSIVYRIDQATNQVVARIPVNGKPCSNLSAGFGSLWVPLCGDTPGLARIDLKTNAVTHTLPFAPPDSEGGIAVSTDSVWMVVDKEGTLVRIDPNTNAVRAKIKVPAESFNPWFADGIVWVTSPTTNELLAVDPAKDAVVATIPVGPTPRFLTPGGGSIWTLNQGDGSVTRVDTKTRKVIATIQAGLPGRGGELCYDFGAIWISVFQIPLTRIDAAQNKVTDQWTGEGGDSIRCGFDAIWLTKGRAGQLWRIPATDIRLR